ncbi:MAG: 50S ribosomal protein L10 [Bacteroidales bacterium]|nr:50S ribosomal protein L10 [Bacteroidales bacterium]RLD39615.1 MAG: 50S ribosomal protein L10 [Bacteroidota bacterium]
MKKEEKDQLINSLEAKLSNNPHIYLTDISGLDAESTSNLRRLAFKNGIKMVVVKNSLLKKAMEKSNKDFEPLFEVLKGGTSLMLSEVGNAPAKMIKEFRKKSEKPILKGAYVEESIYIGDNELDMLVAIKSKDELIGDLIALLQSPAKNVISALSSGGDTLAGVVKTLSERSA